MNTIFHRKRTKRRWAFFLLFAVMFLGMPTHWVTVQAETVHETATAGRVLFLSSYSYAWDTVQLQIEGIKEGIGSGIELDYEFMDTKRVDDEESNRLFTEGLSYRMSKVEPYDVLIVGDDAALQFAMEHEKDLFAGIPVIFEGINSVELAREAARSPLVTGVMEILSFEKNIELARSFYPDAKKVVVILDDTVTGEANRKLFFAEQENYPELEFSEINSSKLTTEQLEAALTSVSTDAILIYVVMNEDASGKHYTNRQSIELIARCAPVPAFRMVEGGIGEGALGGNVVSMRLSGKLAAQMANEIVNGRDPAEFDMIEDSPNVYCLDEAVMRRFGIDLSLIPEGAQVVNHTPSFTERYQELILPGLLLFCILLVIVLMIGIDNLRKGKLAKQLELEQIDLIRANSHDKLTGIRNRAKLEDDIKRYTDKGMLRAAFMIDIDDFKSINDNYGHRVGDDALRQVAFRLHELRSEEMVAYRYAGDEFIVLLCSWNTADIHACAKKCMDIFTEPFDLGGVRLQVSGSMGIAFYGRDMDAKTLIASADQAMYRAKKSGKNGYMIYDGMERKGDMES
ncbi:MAG: ABC transporter substrate binding protein [bacterium]|nr:ABC transporter substrate binding protein [bacterium]MDY4099362.1 ABC transporter substrate binding protein [Lachnospiraceae bacterium]